MKLTTIIVCIIFLFSIQSQAVSPDSKIFKKKYIKGAMTTAAIWQLQHPKHELYDWTNGAFYAGISAAYQTTKDQRLLQAMIEMGEANEWKPGPRLHHADDYAICQTYVDVYRIKKDQKMIQPTIETVNKFLATPYPAKDPQQTITWWWCDALFMAPPALVKLGITLNNKQYLEYSDQLFKETYDLLFDQEEHLFARDKSYQTSWTDPQYEANGKKIFWSRGNGWVMGGLVRILEELPKDYSNRQFYIDIYTKMAEKIADIQQEDGLWRASLLDPASYPGGEASGSGFYCYALAWGINNGILAKDKYLPVVKKAWTGLNSLIQPDGHVGWCQPIGADPKKNFIADSWEVYGTGAFLLAGSEVIKL